MSDTFDHEVLSSHSSDSLPPAMIRGMRDAMATPWFKGFGVYVQADDRGRSRA
jgi:hypothetical protein